MATTLDTYADNMSLYWDEYQRARKEAEEEPQDQHRAKNHYNALYHLYDYLKYYRWARDNKVHLGERNAEYHRFEDRTSKQPCH